MTLTLVPGQLTLAHLRQLCSPTPPQVAIDPACRDGIRASAALVKKATEGDAAVYGVNTGFGNLANQRISQSQLDQYTAQYRAAEAAVRSAEQALRNASLNVGYTELRSPIDGIAAHAEAHVGDYVGPGTQFNVLTTVSNIGGCPGRP